MVVSCTLRTWPTHCWKTKKVHETITFLLVTLSNIYRFNETFTHRLSNKPFLIWLLTTPPHLKCVARKTDSLLATDHELSVGASSKEPVRNRQNFFVHIALSYSKRWRGCHALLNVYDSDWRLLQPGCITRRGRWVLTDVDIYLHLYTLTYTSVVETIRTSRGGVQAAGRSERICNDT